MMDSTLQKIITGCRRGDANAQRTLFGRFNAPLFAVCMRYARDRPEAQDMLQEAFLAIFRDIHQFRADGHLEAWMHRVAVRASLQYLRRKNPLRFAEDLAAVDDGFHTESLDAFENTEAILYMVQQLPPGYRAVFNLRCVESFSYPEIADMLGIAESSVRSQYARACAHLRNLVDRFLIVSQYA